MAATARALWASARSQAAGNCAYQASLLRSWLSGQRAGVATAVAVEKRVFSPTQGQLNDVEVQVTNFHNEDKGLATIAGDVFDVPIRPDIVHRVVRWQLAKRRQGNASTKGIHEVSGTGRKPGPQKGSGRARHGSLRGPQFRGGATQHGPKPRSHEIGLQKQVRRLGLKVALSARIAEGKLKVFDTVQSPTLKTREMERLINGIDGCKKVLIVDDAQPVNEPLCRATANLHYINVLPAEGLNVYSILQHDTLVMTLGAIRKIEDRLHKPINR
jgi:large subunit ribosomal protein L4